MISIGRALFSLNVKYVWSLITFKPTNQGQYKDISQVKGQTELTTDEKISFISYFDIKVIY